MQPLTTNGELTLMADMGSRTNDIFFVLDRSNKVVFSSRDYASALAYYEQQDVPAPLAGVLSDEEWTIETLEGLEQTARRAQQASLSDQTRADSISRWTRSVEYLLANDTRPAVLEVAKAMAERID